ncbi:lactose-binding lectin l-2-like isoform X2 [Ruditapes philippinarum]|uniref:lactose-binding lectin l-2-like isoform X2 n=1 Tax=Ruditapes philippinarum TaxID=129788 RepID=UPI00295BD4AA|nr:lactose-binding lectin l-2-like isoform X2 [Ruditapes philippinarum]
MSPTRFTIIFMLFWNIGAAVSLYKAEDLLKTAVNILNHLIANKHCSSSHHMCPDTWIRFHESCYLFPNKTYMFDDAEHVCIQYGSRLVNIESDFENTFLKNHMRSLKNANYWTGLTASSDRKSWIWHNTNTEAMFLDWSGRSPNNYHGDQECVFMEHAYDFQWNDYSCANKFNPVCEKNWTRLGL